SRFLGLDSNSIIEECKNNKFLNESFMGYGVVERKNNSLKLSPLPTNSSDASSNKTPLTITPQGSIENKSADKEANKEVKESISKESKSKKSGSNLFLRRLLMIIGAILCLLAVSLGAFLITGSRNISNTPIMDKLSDLPFLSGVCKPFILQTTEETYVKVKALALGDWIIDRKVFPGEKIKFSDSKGIVIETPDTTLLTVKYGGKSLDLDSLEDENGTLTYRCH
ncbi:MAG: hypothetical protein SFU25_12115, partial [Candidatus Caenarcaniphilales bacterium]|nr:hypothetical protein [Candidatus Caenarcaniphilales bacterium]